MLLYNAASNRCLLRSVYNNRATFKYLATQTTARNCFDSGTRFRASNIFRSSPNQVRYFGSKAPLSPDVRIYKFPLPAITSIMNRVTSTSLAIGFFAASILVIVNPAYITTIVGFVKTYPQLHYLLKLCLSYAITYHYISGVRRFYWDFIGGGLNTIKQFDVWSRMVFWVPIAISLGLTFWWIDQSRIDSAR